MKKSIIYLGIITVVFSNLSFASNAMNEQQSNTLENVQITLLTSQNGQVEVSYNIATGLEINKFYTVEEIVVFDPKSVLTTYVKTNEEVIAENNQIIESSVEVVNLVSIDTIVEATIANNNQIIDSKVDNVTYPLDFEKINKNCIKTLSNHKVIIAEDLKL